MYEMLMDAKAMAVEASAMAETLKVLLASGELEAEQVGAAHDYLVTATEALEKARDLVK